MQTYVLVHGAWHGAWCWERLAPLLQAQGKKVVMPELPGHGKDNAPIGEQNLETYARAVAKVLDEQEEPVVLAGHSLGGMVISQAAEYRPEKVQKLVYVTAFLPVNGQSCDGLEDGIKPTDWPEMAKTGLVTLSPDGKTTRLSEKFAVAACFNDLSQKEAKKAAAQLGPEALASQYQAAKLSERFDSIPKVFIRCLQDQSFTNDMLIKMKTVSRCEKTYKLNTGHSPFLADPEGLAAILLQIK